MKNSKPRNVKKTSARIQKKIGKSLKANVKKAKKATNEMKNKSDSFFGQVKKKFGKVQNESKTALSHLKNKAYATEEEILDYVRENPIKSVTTLALAGLIAGFITRYKK